MTGTGTLIIHLRDENDNSPMLQVDKLSMCLSEKSTEITAFDLDLHPYRAPFHFELMENVEGRWMLNSSHGNEKLIYHLLTIQCTKICKLYIVK